MLVRIAPLVCIQIDECDPTENVSNGDQDSRRTERKGWRDPSFDEMTLPFADRNGA